MKLMIFAYNSNNINAKHIEKLIEMLESKFMIQSIAIPFLDNNSEPIYCVQYINTDWRDDK